MSEIETSVWWCWWTSSTPLLRTLLDPYVRYFYSTSSAPFSNRSSGYWLRKKLRKHTHKNFEVLPQHFQFFLKMLRKTIKKKYKLNYSQKKHWESIKVNTFFFFIYLTLLLNFLLFNFCSLVFDHWTSRSNYSTLNFQRKLTFLRKVKITFYLNAQILHSFWIAFL